MAYFKRDQKKKRKGKRSTKETHEGEVVKTTQVVPQGQQTKTISRRVKRKRLRKMVVTPPIPKNILEGVEEEEEDPKDTLPLSQRIRVTVVEIEERRKSLTSPSPNDLGPTNPS